MTAEDSRATRHRPENPLHAEDWRVDTCSHDQALILVRRLHYAAGASNTAVFRHGLYRREEWPLVVAGCAMWLPPTPDAARASLIEQGMNSDRWQRVLTLSRLAIESEVPTNAASYLLGRSTRLVKQSKAWDLLVTYADEWQGHTGAVYLAAGWRYVGVTKATEIYVRDGVMVARKAGPKTRTRAEMLALGCECVGKSRKLKFAKVLAR